METRNITIAEGLTRLKIIRKQLNSLNGDFTSYSAWNDKKRHPLGEPKSNIETSINQAREEIGKKFQSYLDLIEEFKTLKRAIDFTNLQTTIEVAGKTMTLHEALMYYKQIKPMYDNLSHSFIRSVNIAEDDVDRYNSQFARVDEDQKKMIQAGIVYFIDKDKIKKITEFNDLFLIEVDGKLNSKNALTNIIWPEV